MPITLEGSCRCGAVTFSAQSNTPYPYQRCYCSICRKAGAGGGYAVNIMADHDTLKVAGSENLAIFTAEITDEDPPRAGSCQRHFCRKCATMLWVWDENWPALMHPFASCIDTELPSPPELVHLMLGSKAPWVTPQVGANDKCFSRYPEQSIEDWHKSRGLWID